MAVPELGETRWKAFKYSRVILKLFVLVFPPVCLSLITTYDTVSFIHLTNSSQWVNITVKFPFRYEAGKTVLVTNATLPHGIQFAADLAITTWLLAGIQCVAFIVAVLALVAYICSHGNANMDSVARVDAVMSALVATCLAIISCLWIYHMITLESNIYSDIDKISKNFLYDDCILEKKCKTQISDFSLLYLAGGISIFSVIIWILCTVEAARYGLTSTLYFQQNAGGILEMNSDMGGSSLQI